MKDKQRSVRISRMGLSHDFQGDDSPIQFPTSRSDDFDHDYQIFLKNLRVDGTSYVFERKAEKGRPAVYLKYGTKNHEESFRKPEKLVRTNAGRHYSGSDRLKSSKRILGPVSESVIDFDLRRTQPKRKLSVTSQNDQTYSREAKQDLEYKKFLEHLKEDGTSYMFELLNSNEAPVCIKYEEVNHLSCDCQEYDISIKFPTSGSDDLDPDYQIFLRYLRVNGKFHVYERKAEKGRPAVYLKYGTGNYKENFRKSEKLTSITTGRCTSGSHGLKSRRSSSPVSDRDINFHLHPTYCKQKLSMPNQNDQTYLGESEVDLEYKTFIEHLREDRTSYMLEMLNGIKGPPVCIKYEGVDHLRESWSWQNANMSTERECCCLDNTYARDMRPVSHHIPHEEESFSLDQRYEPSEREECYLDKANVRSVTPVPSHVLHEGYFSLDQSYQFFLEHVRSYNFHMILELDNGVSITYKEENEFHEIECPLSSHKFSKSDKYSQVDSNISVHQQNHTIKEYGMSTCYEKRLAVILAKPFNWKEYRDLYYAAYIRKPLQKELHLRGGTKSYDTNILSPSYLDRFPELARKLAVADPQHRLTLLRGFFFWLKNLVHEGAYMPWIENSSSHGSDHITLDD